MIETLFVYNKTNAALSKEREPASSTNQENGLLDPKKSQNIAILLRALNVSKEEVCEAILEGFTYISTSITSQYLLLVLLVSNWFVHMH